jgi:hypothetical protein
MPLTDIQHQQCLEYYSALLSVRDRDEITNVLCRQTPDRFTQAIREGFAAFDPMIRTLHDRVDLRDYVETTRVFMDDFIKTGKPKKTDSAVKQPSVEDYADLIRRHRHVMFKWLHEIASKCPEIREPYRLWANDAAKALRSHKTTDTSASSGYALNGGDMEDELNALFTSIPEESQTEILSRLDAHAQYLTELHDLSMVRLQGVLDTGQPGGASGPGLYLARWQSLLDETVITPEKPGGLIRHGRDVKFSTTMGKTGATTPRIRGGARSGTQTPVTGAAPVFPDVCAVTRALGEQFRAVLAARTRGPSVENGST